jgi:hypothetical protein
VAPAAAAPFNREEEEEEEWEPPELAFREHTQMSNVRSEKPRPLSLAAALSTV